MELHIIALTTLLLAVVGSNATPCPSGCKCSRDIFAGCNRLGLQAPPAGYFPNIQQLELNYNNISEIGDYDLTGFPNLVWLYIQHNPLTEFKFDVLAHAKNLRYLFISDNKIQKIVPLSEGNELSGLNTLYMQDNPITSIPEDFLDRLPTLSILDASSSSLVLPGDRPLFSSETLSYLTLGQVDASSISDVTLSALPRLSYLYMAYSDFPDESGTVFAKLRSLSTLTLKHTDLKAIRRGAFSKEQNITWLFLEDSQLETLETSAVEGVVKTRIDISNTPMACKCKHEALYWWSIARGISVEAPCKESSTACIFTRRMKRFT